MFTSTVLFLVIGVFLVHTHGNVDARNNESNEREITNNVSNLDEENEANSAPNSLDYKELVEYIRNLESNRLKRSIDVNEPTETSENEVEIDLNETEECVGSEEYCNMTKEEYLAMMNDYIYPQTYEWILIGTHTVVFIIGLVGNALVCIAVYRNHTMRTVTNYFIVNLAVADFMVILFCLPPTVLWDVTETWFLGNALCKMLLYFQVRDFNFVKQSTLL